MDALAWHVDARNGESGFSPHRDRQPDDSKGTFRPDGSAMYTTCWIALSEASPETGCLYVIPRQFDPGYLRGSAFKFQYL
jgi:ectoine hydroxylase-related dioxygenase (phytanoyl-CoA dioxygenase family)